MSSALGKQLGLTEESTLEEIVIVIGNVIDYSNDIQYATTDTSDQAKSCYQINGNYIDVVPSRGLWNNWNWGVSCIRVPRGNMQGTLIGYISGSGNINVTSYTSNYANLTTDNFIVESYSFPAAQTSNVSGGTRCAGRASGTNLSKSYNPSTGILSIWGLSQSACMMDNTTTVKVAVTQAFSARVYMVC